MIKDFLIPLNKDELLRSSSEQYSVEHILPPSMIPNALEACRVALQTDGASFILKCFDTFFSVLLHINKLEFQYVLLSFKRIFKGVQILVADMEKVFDHDKEIEEEERPRLLCLNKMSAYLISQFICYIEGRIIQNSNTIENSTKRKKNTKSDEEEEWNDEQQKVLELIYRWLQLPLQKIWKLTIVEDSFIRVLSQVCYNVLEHCKDAKQKHTRQTIFEILGTLSKKYNHGTICIAKIVQLVKSHDTLPAYISAGVVYMDVECGCHGFLKQLIKEIDQTKILEAENRNVSIFLENIALLKPDIMLPIMDDILEYLTSEHYTMRNCAIGIIGTVISKVLTGENLTPEQREQRDECLNSLYEHILDSNAYVRSKVLNVWQNLCCEGSIPLARQGKLLTACVLRLQDKSASVRKQALQLLRTLIQSNPFAAKLNDVDFLKSVDKEKIKLKELQSQIASDSRCGDSERLELWNMLLPDIRKAIEKIIDSHNKKENREEFTTELKNAIPSIEALLFSTISSDAVEACTLLGIASQFGVTGADAAIRKALYQAFHRDQSVRRNLAIVYKQLYLDDIDSQTKKERQKANSCVRSLIHLIKELQPGQSQALKELIISWYNNKEISEETLQILWEKFSMKSPDTTPLESRAALILIMMISHTEKKIIVDNLDVLVKIGLGPRAKTDLLLARDTCRILQRIEQTSENIEVAPLKYPNDHNMFKEIIALLVENFCDSKENGYISFATDAINVIYKLADQPHHLMKTFLLDILERGQFTSTNDNKVVISSIILSNLLYLVGHIAIREMVYLDTTIYKELKRRNIVQELRKSANSNKDENKSYAKSVSFVMNNSNRSIRNKETNTPPEDNGEEALEGAIDDADAEFINNALESEIVAGNGLLAKFVSIVLDVCQHPEKYDDENLQAAGALALCKMMTVSSTFCETSLQLLVTILERSPYPGIRANVLVGLNDLMTRFPNEVEPWTKHIYGRLRDEDRHVRSTCVRVLSNLITREMVRVKGQVSELALCIIDEDIQIQKDTRQFFQELSQRGYALYNIIPDILSQLSDSQLNLSESHFQEILGFILGLVQKEKQIDAIIEKICARFKLATTERQWHDLSYCLSVLQFSVKSIRHLIECLPLLKDKIYHKQVFKTLQGIIEQTKKKPDAKDVCLELEEKIKQLLEGSENVETPETNDNTLMPPPPSLSRKKTRKVSQKDSEEDDSCSDSDSDSQPAIKKNHAPRSAKKKSYNSNVASNSSSESDDEDNRQKTPANSLAKTKLSIRSSTRSKTHRKDLDNSSNIRSPLPKRNKSSKTAETPAKTPSRTSTRTPVKAATRSLRSSARLL
ncbi:hypothetical protein KPH14_006510 [Odynerus spinipes]|uniref:Condensin complex subunit 1 n=1 Tax=Odynerus spinipes TaxID=1348599 RepID=A0AAD9RRK1_9HYME|nr:hypothetical protein KPH14_006510 [Odynerus spinipes]